MQKILPLIAALVLILSAPALAHPTKGRENRKAAESKEETGVASIHEWRKVGRRTCLVGHYHDGEGVGLTRRVAERDAIEKWVEFTAWEYGRAWGFWRNAINKTVNCSATGSHHQCKVSAIPCRSF